MHWYYSEAGKAQGPFTEQKLSELVRAGVLSAETLIWQPELEEWKPVIILLPTTLQPEPRKLDIPPVMTSTANPFAVKTNPAKRRPSLFQRLFGRKVSEQD